MAESRYLRDSTIREANPPPVTGKCCAYNQTRERFLYIDVEAGDFDASALDTRLPLISMGSNSALWIVPRRDIPPTSVRLPIDLIYLDANCAVLDAVESFPLADVPPAAARAASVLALPAGTIATAGTRQSDQLILCSAQEMKVRLQQLAQAKAARRTTEVPVPVLDQNSRSTAGRVLPFDRAARPNSPSEVSAIEAVPAAVPAIAEREPAPLPAPAIAEPHSKLIAAAAPAEVVANPAPAAVPAEPVAAPSAAEPAPAKPKAQKSWLQRLLASELPDARKSNRETIAGLSAYFFTGADPVPHGVRDISPTGFYVLTEERWYPGTVIRMTLTDGRKPTAERSITVNASVMRAGSDGVGLRFIFPEDKSAVDGMMAGASKAQVEQFLRLLKASAG